MTESKSTSTPQHRTAKGAQRIRDLTAVAAELFLERGFETVAIDDLIARVGGSRRNVYSHFGGKEGLFIEAVKKLCAEVAAPLAQLSIGDGDPRAALQAFGLALLQIVTLPRTLELHRLMVAEGRRFPELAQAVFHAGHSQGAKILATWIEKRQMRYPKGTKSQLPSLAVAGYFVNMVVMDVQLRALTGLVPVPLPPKEAQAIVANAVALFLDGVSL
ncbi:TPA: TetR/AcrR family transcriptional regulator [Burkholderia cenocepacia]|nr:TetR/AcrR family transcriptional regulator [Burkholderia cenocepacia]